MLRRLFLVVLAGTLLHHDLAFALSFTPRGPSFTLRIEPQDALLLQALVPGLSSGLRSFDKKSKSGLFRSVSYFSREEIGPAQKPLVVLGLSRLWFEVFPLKLTQMRLAKLSDRQIAQKLGMREEWIYFPVTIAAFAFFSLHGWGSPIANSFLALSVRALIFTGLHRKITSIDADGKFTSWVKPTWKDHVVLQTLNAAIGAAGLWATFFGGLDWVGPILLWANIPSMGLLLGGSGILGLVISVSLHALYNRWAPPFWPRAIASAPVPEEPPQFLSKQEFLHLTVELQRHIAETTEAERFLIGIRSIVRDLTERQWAISLLSPRVRNEVRELHAMSPSQYQEDEFTHCLMSLLDGLVRCESLLHQFSGLSARDVEWLHGRGVRRDPLDQRLFQSWQTLQRQIEMEWSSGSEVPLGNFARRVSRMRSSSGAWLQELAKTDLFLGDLSKVARAIHRIRRHLEQLPGFGLDAIFFFSAENREAWAAVGHPEKNPPLYRYTKMTDPSGDEKAVLAIRLPGDLLYASIALIATLLAAKPWQRDSRRLTKTEFGVFLQEAVLLPAQRHVIQPFSQLPAVAEEVRAVRDFDWDKHHSDADADDAERSAKAHQLLEWREGRNPETQFVETLLTHPLSGEEALQIFYGDHTPLIEALGQELYQALMVSFETAGYRERYSASRRGKALFFDLLTSLLVEPYRNKPVPKGVKERLPLYWEKNHLEVTRFLDREKQIKTVAAYSNYGRDFLEGRISFEQMVESLHEAMIRIIGEPGADVQQAASIARAPRSWRWLGIPSLVWLEEIAHVLVGFGFREGIRQIWIQRKGLYQGSVLVPASGSLRGLLSGLAGPAISILAGGILLSGGSVLSFIGALTWLRVLADLAWLPFHPNHELRPVMRKALWMAKAA